MQTFFLSGSRTPQCLSKSHSLSEDAWIQSELGRHSDHIANLLPVILLTGRHFVVRSRGSVALNGRRQRGVLPLVLAWGPVAK